MSINDKSFREFLTPQRTLSLKTKKGKTSRSYKLRRVNLNTMLDMDEAFATEEKPNGFQNALDRIAKGDNIVSSKFLYILIEDKTDFPTFDDFIKELNKYSLNVTELATLFNKIINDAVPIDKKKVAVKGFKIIQGLIVFIFMSCTILLLHDITTLLNNLQN